MRRGKEDTLDVLISLAKRNKVTLCWIKAHVGTEGNEEADMLAKGGTRVHGPPRCHFPTCLNEGKSRIKQDLTQSWMKNWEKSKSCRQTKLWFPVRYPCKTNAILTKNRQQASALVRFITGFNGLAYHEFNIGKKERPNCTLCDSDREDVAHLTQECPVVLPAMLRIFGTEGISSQWSVNNLTKLLSYPAVKRLLES
jgi:ribonuclease HI